MHPASLALVRLIGPARAKQVELVAIPSEGAPDHYRIEGVGDHIRVSGTSPATLLAGFGWYLRTVAHGNISINGSQLNLPATLPKPAAAIERTANVRHRFALNDTNEGYAGAYLSWPEWQRRIDVLALNGINEVLVYEGQDAVYQQTFEALGYSPDEMRAWIPQPAHQPWWLLQNLCCIGSPISQQLIDRRAALGCRIADYLRSLGLTPVFPGYYGTVPPGFADKNPTAHIVPQGTWSSSHRPDWLDPTTPLFAKVAAIFYAKQTALFGASTMYKMDLLHEGGDPGDVPVRAAARAVQAALERAHPGAIWAILGWWDNPRKDVLEGIDRSRALIVDGTSEGAKATDREADFIGTPYAFGTIWNFGGRTNMGAPAAAWNAKYHRWHAKRGSKLSGIALMPEAIANNPAAVAFFADLAWEPDPVDLDRWFTDWATARYGAADPHAAAAWRRLGRSVYSWPADVDTKPTTGLFSVEPRLDAKAGPVPYDADAVIAALHELLQVAPSLRDSSAYRYDLIAVSRQVLDNDGKRMLPLLRAAYRGHDRAAFDRLRDRWLAEMALLDRLLAGDSSQLFGAWEKRATSQAATPAEAAKLLLDVRSLVTIWDADNHIQDYARREWNGLVGDYYMRRWRTFFGTLDTALASGRPPAAIDWDKFAIDWARETRRYPTEPAGDTVALAQQIAVLVDVPLN